MKQDVRDSDLDRKNAANASGRDIGIHPVKDVPLRLACIADVYLFLKTCFQSVFSQPFTPARREMIDAICRAARESGDQAIAGPRGDGKTRSALFTAFWLSLTGQSAFPMVISKSGTRAELELKNVKWAVKESPQFSALFPEIADPIAAMGGWASRARQMTVYGHRIDMEWAVDSIALPTIPTELLKENNAHWRKESDLQSVANGQLFVSIGIEGPVRGYSVRNKRPTLAIIDDIDDRESANSDVQTVKRIEIIDSDIAGMGALDRGISRVMLCTLLNRKCAAYVFTDRKQRASFRGQRHKLITKMPDREDLWREYVTMREARDPDADPDARVAHRFYLERREIMDAGHESSNPYRFNSAVLADGEPAELSVLQSFYNFVADNKLPAALSELQNDPPPDENEGVLPITAYHVKTNCRSGLDRGIVPEGTVAITVGADIKKLGMHHVTIAWSDRAVGSIVDYDFYPFSTEGMKPAACELLILEGLQEWWGLRKKTPFCEASGVEWQPDVVLVDSGWKDDGWNQQPVALFADYVGTGLVIPSKGIPHWRPKQNGPKCLSGDNYNLVVLQKRQLAEVNADHWKIRVHEGFLQPFGEPGSLGLFTPPRDQWGREPAGAHLKYSKEVTSERWGQFGPSRTWKWAPADNSRTQKPNHYLDATALALCGRAMIGVSTIPEPEEKQLAAAAVITEPQFHEPMTAYGGTESRAW